LHYHANFTDEGGFSNLMRLATIQIDGSQRLGVVENGEVLLPPAHSGWPDSMLALIDAGPSRLRALARELPGLRQVAERVGLDEVRLAAPIPRPRKNIICLGWNYLDHVRESAATRKKDTAPPTDPIVFTKNVTSVTGPRDDVPSHADVTSQLDWEAELAVVIGVGGRAIERERALAHVFGYTVINDVSARDVQFRHKQYFLGKSLDGTCPMGPWIVTADEIPDPQNLAIGSRVNGTPKQNSNTRHMLFDIATIIAVLSRGMTLEPGDIISTGTPDGVGFARTPPEFLKSGDVVECEVEGIGVLRNRVA
jgi:2-keto-4-pentenoate hydratase/2-oxohepta-3-ene-1,7-dioic acid hydratase in catechol pathway